MTEESISPPPFYKTVLEARTFLELGAMFTSLPLLQAAPRGDGHPVLVYPGFLASNFSTIPLRRYLRRRGYWVRGWNHGRNLGYSPELLDAMIRRVGEVYQRFGRKVSLIGWSLGGIYARELGRRLPHQVRQVISMGSPIAGDHRATRVRAVYERVTGTLLHDVDPDLLDRIRTPPPVPSTSIFSHDDGIVAWRCSLEAEGPQVQNIRVVGSHIGFGHNPLVLWLVADRLAQDENNWQPFEPSGIERLLPMKPAPSRGRGRVHWFQQKERLNRNLERLEALLERRKTP